MRTSKTKGFTLIEIAVVLGILSLLAFMLAPLAGSLVSSARLRDTKARIEPIKAALISYVTANSRLPCPAVESLPVTDANYGREAATPGTCTAATALTGGASRGVLPWATLGLNGDAVVDGYGRFFTYAVTTSLTSLNANTVSGMTGVLILHSGTPVTAANQLNVGNLAAYLVISHGNNGFGAFNPGSGAQTPFTGGSDELENTNTTNVDFVDKAFADDSVNPFDDIVAWVTPREILSALGQSGVKTPQGALTDKFQSIRNALLSYIATDSSDPDGIGTRTVYRRVPNADTNFDGTEDLPNLTGTVPFTSLGISPAITTDPWGHAIRYFVSAAALAKSNIGASAGLYSGMTPGAAITLASDGPDGNPTTADDVFYTIAISEMMGALIAAKIPMD